MAEPWRRREVIGRHTLYLGDCLAILPAVRGAAVDLVLTDPPYSSGGMMRGDRTQDTRTKYVNGDSVSGQALAGFSGDTRDQLGYWGWCAVWLEMCREAMAPGAILGMFSDWRQLPVSCIAIQSGGLVWRGIVPWHKPAARPVQGRWANACEYVLWGTNGPRVVAGPSFPGFLSVSSPQGQQRVHIAQKPVALLSELCRIAAGGIVLDPFMGSGSTLVAAQAAGLTGVGIEMDEAHFEHACRRVAKAVAEDPADG